MRFEAVFSANVHPVRRVLGSAFALVAFVVLLDPHFANAQQPGESVPCVEGSSTSMSYADHAFCRIDNILDVDTFFFDGTAGTEIRIQAVGTSGSVVPNLEIRDPSGAVIYDGLCTDGCESSNFDIDPSDTLAVSGTYQVQISESGSNNVGNYQVNLNCLDGACSGLSRAPVLEYDATVLEALSPQTDMDFFGFQGTAGTEIRIEAVGTSGSVFPNVEIRDPDGALLHDGACLPAGVCEPSSFNLLPSPTLAKTGHYMAQISEVGSNNVGNYQITLNCLDGACDPDLDLELHLTDNCGNVANPLQADTDMDGLGDLCDPDYDNDGTVTAEDFAIFLQSIGCQRNIDDCYNPNTDHDGDGFVSADDFGTFLKFFGKNPGPGSISIGYDSTAFESLTPQTEMDFLNFEGAAGTEIRIQAIGTSGSVAPNIEIRAPDGGLLYNGSCSAGCEPMDFNIPATPIPTLPQTGTYQIQISEAGSNNIGRYQVSLNCLDGPCPGVPAASALAYDSTAFESFSAQTEMDFLSFEGAAGTEIRIEAVGTSGSVVPAVEIRDPDGVLLHDDLCLPAGVCETSSFSELPSDTLAKTGTYQIQLSESGSNNVGNYQVSLNCLDGACPGVPAATSLLYDMTAFDTLSPQTEMDFFSFEGAVDTQIRLIAVGTSGSVTLNVEIRDPDGVPLHDGLCLPADPCETSMFNLMSSPSLPKTGTYQVQISEVGSNNIGNYQVALNCLFGACPEGGE